MADEPSFEEALDRFNLFLKHEGHEVPIVWVQTENIALLINNPCVKVPFLAMSKLKDLYQSGVGKGNGVALEILGVVQDKLLATIVVPKDAKEAEEKWISGLKLSVPTRLISFTVIESWLYWKYISFFSKPELAWW